MSLKAMLAVFEHSRALRATRLVLLAMADHAHDDGSNAFAAVPTLARKARVADRSVQRSLRWAEDECEIVAVGRTKRGVVVYHMTVVSPLAATVEGRHHVTGGATPRHPRGDTASPEPYLEPVLEERTTSGDILSPLDDPAPLEVVANVLSSRDPRAKGFVVWLRGVGRVLADSPRDFAAEMRERGTTDPELVELYRRVALGATLEDLNEGRDQ